MADLTGAPWHKSTRSGPNNNCVEVALLASGAIVVRDTKQNGAGPVLEFTEAEWIAFLAGVRRGEFDVPGPTWPGTPERVPRGKVGTGV